MTIAEVYEFGEFRLDIPERRLSRRGLPIPLAPKAHDVLTMLVRRAGRLVTKRELLATIWPDSFVEEGILAVHVSGLRRALGEANRVSQYIETVSGSGYRFIREVHALVSSSGAPNGRPLTSLAVLPFRPLTMEARDGALEMGIVDSLISALGTRDDIVVRPLSAVRKYTSLEQDPVAAGREILVNFVLDGTIQRSGNHIRITIRLLNVADGTSPWSATFDDQFVNIFGVEDAIVEQVTRTLRLTPGGKARAGPAKHHTHNSEAYLLYLRGHYLWERRTPGNSGRAIACYEAAIEKDPSYALAYAGLADCYETMSLTSGHAPHGVFPKAKEAALRALEIDESLAEAHRALAGVMFWYEWNWKDAAREFERAIDLNPNQPATHRFYGHFLSNRGRHDEAFREVRKALDLDPLSTLTNARLGQFLYQAGEYDQALQQLTSTLELDPSSPMVRLNLGRVYERKGMHPESVAELRKACELSGSGEARAMLGYSLAASGQADEARSIMAELAAEQSKGFVQSYNMALICAGLDERQRALEHLDVALGARDVGLTFVNVEPKWRPFDRDEAFRRVTTLAGFPPRRSDASNQTRDPVA